MPRIVAPFQSLELFVTDKKRIPLAAVIFDLDGTLVDSAPDLAAALNQVLADHGHGPLNLSQVAAIIGDGMPILVSRAFAAAGVDANEHELAAETKQFRAIYEARATELTRPYPGAVEVLRNLRASGASIGVCTNKPHRSALNVLEGLDLMRFVDGVVGGDRAKYRKPDGRHLLEVIAAMGAAPEHAVYVGDSETDLAAARDAAIPAVLVDFGYSKDPVTELGADAVISNFGSASV